MKEALIIRHVAFEDLGNLSHVLKSRGYSLRYAEAGRDNIAALDYLAANLVIVLGGPISANDENDYSFLTDELRLLDSRLQRDLPTLGICLGAQLMARALGGRVYRGHEKEIGWAPLKVVGEPTTCPLVHLDSVSVLHWHQDTFDIPEGAQLLASSNKYMHQAFSWKRCGLALQFHAEVTAKGLEQWYIGHTHEISCTPSVSVSNLRGEAEQHASRLQTHASRLWNTWLDVIEAP